MRGPRILRQKLERWCVQLAWLAGSPKRAWLLDGRQFRLVLVVFSVVCRLDAPAATPITHARLRREGRVGEGGAVDSEQEALEPKWQQTYL